MIEAFLNACQILESGSITYKEVPDLLSESSEVSLKKDSGGPAFFDEVTNIDLWFFKDLMFWNHFLEIFWL